MSSTIKSAQDFNKTLSFNSSTKVVFRGNGIDFQSFQDRCGGRVVVAELAPQEMIPGRSRLLRLQLTQIINPDGSITLNGQVAAHIRNLIIQNQQGQTIEIATNQGNFSFNNVQAGVYQLLNAADPQMRTSVAVASSNNCAQAQLEITEAIWRLPIDWSISYNIINPCPGIAYQLYIQSDDGARLMRTTLGGCPIDGCRLTPDNSNFNTIPTNQLDNTSAFLVYSNGQIQSDTVPVDWTIIP